MGYFVTLVSAATVDPSTFFDYDLVILSCGDNTAHPDQRRTEDGAGDFARTAGISWSRAARSVTISTASDFGTYVLHTNDWNHDNSGDVQVGDPDAYILNNPNHACGDMALTYDGYGDSDAMVPLPGAAMPLTWSSYPTDAAMITFDPNPAPEGGQIVYFCFNYLAVDQSVIRCWRIRCCGC